MREGDNGFISIMENFNYERLAMASGALGLF
jgi:alkylation response protein AidB-like acyl-CoA dehydrogenase